MSLPPQISDKNWLIFEDYLKQPNEKELPLIHSKREYTFWSDRLILIEDKSDEEFWNFTAFDLLMNEERKIQFRKTRDESFTIADVYPLNDNFGLIIETHYLGSIRNFNLVKFDLKTNEFQLVQNFEQNLGIFWPIFNKSQSEKFVLTWKNDNRPLFNYQVCRLVERKIECGEIYMFRNLFKYYSEDQLVQIESNQQYGKKLIKYDLTLKNEEIFDLGKFSLPKNCQLGNIYQWANNCLYNNFCFDKDTRKFGIAYTDLMKKHWELLNFETDFWICHFQYFNDSLIVNAGKVSRNNGEYSSEVKFYGIPTKRPNFLRYSAWLCVVRIMKNMGEKDPYKSAKEYLPLNSDLRSFYFKNV